MLDYDSLVKLVTDCKKSYINSEEGLKRHLLGLDLDDFEVDLTDSDWYKKHNIKGVVFQLSDQSEPLIIKVDLAYFCIEDFNSLGNLMEIKDDDIEKNGICDNFDYMSLDIEYHVVSQKDRGKSGSYKYFCDISSGEVDYKAVFFDIDIIGGIHEFKCTEVKDARYTLDISVLKHFKDCVILTDSIFLFLQDYDILKRNNIQILDYKDLQVYIGVISKYSDDVSDILKVDELAKEGYYNTDKVYVRLFHQSETTGTVIWLCNLLNSLISIKGYKKIRADRIIYIVCVDCFMSSVFELGENQVCTIEENLIQGYQFKDIQKELNTCFSFDIKDKKLRM